ncbi:MAG TPA: transcriptional regulator [Kutzneria sp.]|nr:transcriptional regulator [Kutzneria sp.]
MPQRTTTPDPAAVAAGGFKVDPAAIPSLRRVFTTALVKLDKQIEMAVSDVRIRPWAGDPVSEQAASDLNEHTLGVDSALDALQRYQRQLKGALDALTEVEQGYHTVEQDNTSLIQQGGC